MSSQIQVNLFAALRLFKQCKHEMSEEYFCSELQELAGNLKRGRLPYQLCTDMRTGIGCCSSYARGTNSLEKYKIKKMLQNIQRFFDVLGHERCSSFILLSSRCQELAATLHGRSLSGRRALCSYHTLAELLLSFSEENLSLQPLIKCV